MEIIYHEYCTIHFPFRFHEEDPVNSHSKCQLIPMTFSRPCDLNDRSQKLISTIFSYQSFGILNLSVNQSDREPT